MKKKIEFWLWQNVKHLYCTSCYLENQCGNPSVNARVWSRSTCVWSRVEVNHLQSWAGQQKNRKCGFNSTRRRPDLCTLLWITHMAVYQNMINPWHPIQSCCGYWRYCSNTLHTAACTDNDDGRWLFQRPMNCEETGEEGGGEGSLTLMFSLGSGR